MSGQIANNGYEYRWGSIPNGRVRHAMYERPGNWWHPLCGEVYPTRGDEVRWESASKPCRTCSPTARRIGLDIPAVPAEGVAGLMEALGHRPRKVTIEGETVHEDTE